MMAVREFYEYATNKAVKRLGHHAWLGGMILTIEVMIWVKFGREAKEFTQPFPTWVLIFWTVVVLAFAAWFFFHFYLVPLRLHKGKSRTRASKRS